MPDSSPVRELIAGPRPWIFNSPVGPRIYLAPDTGSGDGGFDTTSSDVEDANAAGSSDAGNEPGAEPSFMDAIKASVSEDEGSPTSEDGQPVAEPEQPEAPKAETPSDGPREDPTEDELKRYPQNAQSRIREVIGQRNEGRAEIEAMRPKVEAFEQVSGFMRNSGLSAEEVDNTFQIAALIKNDPVKAFEALRPIYEQLQGVVGERLPDDLEEEVRTGYLSRDRAKELARLRAGTNISQARDTRSREEAARQQAADRDRQQVADARDALNGWEQSQSRNDPDWSLKRGRLDELLELKFRREGRRPSSKQEAVSWGDEALKRVNAEFARFRPRPNEMKAPTSGRAQSSNRPSAPASVLDAVKMALAG